MYRINLKNEELRKFRVGYACLNSDVKTKYRTCRQRNLTIEKWHELIKINLSVLKEMIEYNRKMKLSMYRISSDLIPFGSADVLDYDWANIFQKEFAELRELLKNRIRFSMHPGQYTVLNSLSADVVERALKDLEYHVKVMRLLGATRKNKVVLHIGGIYGDKPSAIKRFVEVANGLDQSILDHLIIENDDRSYNIKDVLEISEQTGLPVVFDNLHHEINLPEESRPMKEWIEAAGRTWQAEDGRQIIHYSQQAEGKRTGAHSATIDSQVLLQFLDSLDEPLDIMLEVKDKNRSTEKLQMILNKDLKMAERLWARQKYSMLSRSQPNYQEVRQLLKDKTNVDFKRIAELFEQTEKLAHSPGDAVNAADHVWGYFKKQTTDKEKNDFRKLMDSGIPDSDSERIVRKYLTKMLKKYPNGYLEESYYFNESLSHNI